jgi:hypothetical protein
MSDEVRVVYRNAPTNGLGIAGFVVSLVGFLGSCFGAAVICPIGAILSGIALRRPPRGFAIAGFIIGLIGSLWLIVGVMFLGAGGLLFGLMFSQIKEELHVHAVADAVEQYRRDTGFLPLTLDELVTKYPGQVEPEFVKNLGYRQTDVDKFVIIRPGQDKLLGTADDVEFVPPSQSSSPTSPSSPASTPSPQPGDTGAVERAQGDEPAPVSSPGN